MNTIKFTSKTTCRLNGVDYKGYLVGDGVPPNGAPFGGTPSLTHLALTLNILVKTKMVITNIKKVNHTGLTTKV